jgi:4-hydroxythreonine-4-phosphate dehydrogenase
MRQLVSIRSTGGSPADNFIDAEELTMASRTIAITIGDPAGIGPEIGLKAAASMSADLQRSGDRLVLVGNREVMDRTADALGLERLAPIAEVTTLASGGVGLLETPALREPVITGEISAEGGRQSFEAIRISVDAALSGSVDAIVTAPLSKEALHRAGHYYAGHTELLAELTGVSSSVMMLAHGDFRVTHVTTHCALADVPKRATAERIARVLHLTLEALASLGVDRPRIAVAALNPHAGEGGAFGRQDIDVTAPVVEDFRRRGHAITGPVPGDTVFVKMKAGDFDAVVAMYHDQGHIPVKLLGFSVDKATGQWTSLSGVNVTLGLPIIRTSVDHGTAFDIAGKGVALPSSLIEAIDYAAKLIDGRAR